MKIEYSVEDSTVRIKPSLKKLMPLNLNDS